MKPYSLGLELYDLNAYLYNIISDSVNFIQVKNI